METLRRCFPSRIRQILDELPTTLDETYERILSDIPEENWKHAYRLIQCLVFSFRPLHIDELAEVFATRFNSETTPDLIQGWRLENTEDAVLSACSSLIAIVEVGDSPVVQISHFSVQEFFMSNQLSTISSRNVSRYYIAPEPAHKILAQACLGTLLELDEHIDKNRLEDYPLAFYAAQCWFKHARFGDVSLSILDSMGQLFDPDKPHFSAWIWIHDVHRDRRIRSIEDLPERPPPPKNTPLYYSAACGVRSLAEHVIAFYPEDVNPQEKSKWSPLRVAVENGHVDVARLLLEHGAFPNPVVGRCTLLHHASRCDDSDDIQLLIDHGADVDCTDDTDRTPLHLASANGCVRAMQRLLLYGADVNKHMRHGWTPLHRASTHGTPEGIRLLFRHGANINEKDGIGWTALHWASFKRRPEITQALLECGADVYARDKSDRTPFQLASIWKHHDVAQLLLEYSE